MIGSKIRELRKARKLSQEDLAEKISEISGESISRQSLSGWETGTVQPRTANLQAAAQALGVPLSALLDDGEAPMPSDVTPLTVPRGRMISVPLLSREVTACCGEGIPAYDEIQNPPDEIYRYSIGELGGIYDDLRPPVAVRADGACLEKSRIFDGDVLIINPAVVPRQGQICVVCWDGALSAKKVVRHDDGGVTLYSDVDAFKLSAAEVAEPTRFSIWGPVVQLRRTIR
jgi:transcriptional regulator with XRE-family HTH domain